MHEVHQGGAQDALGVVHEVHSKDYIDEGLPKEGQTRHLLLWRPPLPWTNR